MRPCRRVSQPCWPDLDVDVGVIYTHERSLMDRLVSTLPAAAEGVRMRLILVDNRSADGIEQWKDRVARTLLVHNTRRLGYAANLNRVLRASSARYVLLLNTDMYFDWRDPCVARMVGFMDRQPRCGIAGCRLYHEDGDPAYAARRFQTLPILMARRLGLAALMQPTLDHYFYRDRDPAGSWECDWLSGCFLMIRRAAFEEVGFFDEAFRKYFEDVDMCYRMARCGWQVMYHGATSCCHLEARASRRLGSRDAWEHLRSYLRWHWKWGFSYAGEHTRREPLGRAA